MFDLSQVSAYQDVSPQNRCKNHWSPSRASILALDVKTSIGLFKFIINCVGSSQANPFACIASGIAALWGPAHGGANEAVLQMLQKIGTKDNIPAALARAKDKSTP